MNKLLGGWLPVWVISVSILAASLVGGAQIWLGGHMDIDKGPILKFPNVNNNTFSFELAPELKKMRDKCVRGECDEGFTLAARVSSEGAVSVWTDEVSGYPMAVMTKDEDGNSVLSLPGKLTFKLDVKPHVLIHAEGFDIETTREIEAGESFAALCFNGESILSAKAVDTNGSSRKMPSIRIFSAGAKNRTTAFVAWRFEIGLR